MHVLENTDLKDPPIDPNDSNPDLETDVLVIGGGFGGVYALWKFRQLGLKTKLFEAGNEFGGTWHWSRYPGARVDSEMPYYSLSVPEVWKTWNWTERFPSHKELKEYFRHVDKTLDLSKDAYFNTIATSVKYLDGKWVINTRDGRVSRCTYLILATGSSYKKNTPDFQGLDSYRGKLVHTAEWPREGLDVSGKRVGVIGNGATGVQVVQELGKQDCELSVFIRNPIHALPMRQRKMSTEEQETSKTAYSFLYEGAQKSRAGFPFKAQTKGFWQSTPEERKAILEEGWSRGGFAFNQTTYRDFIYDREANKVFYDFWATKVRERVTDQAKAQIVAPIPQQTFFATRRPSLEQNYYDVINQPNVKLVDLKPSPIRRLCESGIVCGEQLHELDVIVLATGYDAVTGSLLEMGLEDKNGVALQEKWKSGVRTHLGLMIPEMPNLFMVYGPQAPTSFSNGPPIIEIQVDIVAEAVTKCRRERISLIEASQEAAAAWADEVREIGDRTLYPTANSWYMGANVPGKPREMLLYLGGVDVYAEKCRAALESWEGFIVTRQEGNPAGARL